MQTDEKNLKAVETWAGQLACPVCFSALALSVAQAVCAGCGRSYPVVNGIPILIAERAATAPEER